MSRRFQVLLVHELGAQYRCDLPAGVANRIVMAASTCCSSKFEDFGSVRFLYKFFITNHSKSAIFLLRRRDPVLEAPPVSFCCAVPL